RDRPRSRPARRRRHRRPDPIGSALRMRRRLSALFIVAAVSGTLAGTVADAKGRTPIARIPAIPRLPEIANACPVPAQYRLALAAYNGGPTAVERVGGAPSTDVATYVVNVTDTWRALRGCR